MAHLFTCLYFQCLKNDIVNCVIILFSFLCLGKPSQLFEKDDPDWAPTKKMGHKKTNCHTRISKLSPQKKGKKSTTEEKSGCCRSTCHTAEKQISPQRVVTIYL